MSKIICTVVFLLDQEKHKVYMGKKTQKIGIGKFTGPGGKVDGDETLTACAVREVKEEIGVELNEADLEKAAVVSFQNGPDFEAVVHFYFSSAFSGTPADGDEMTDGAWFPIADLITDPRSAPMMEADYLFLPLLLSGKKIIARCVYEEGSNQGKILEWGYEEVEQFAD